MDHVMQPGLIEIAIEPKTKADNEKLNAALDELAARDSSFHVSLDQESGQTILKGVSESQLDDKIDLLKRIYGIDARIGAPQVAFLERVTKRVEHSYTYKKQSGPKGQFAAVTLVIEPNKPGEGYVFESKAPDGVVPDEYLPGIEKGLNSVLRAGVVAGFPVVDVRVQLVDGKFHDVDSSQWAFEIAARACFREALQLGKSVLLEPIMKVEVMAPKDCLAAVRHDLNLRRARSETQGISSDGVVLGAMVPLMNMFGYANSLRPISHGRGTFTMQFDHYAEAPPNDGGNPPFGPAVGMRA